MARRQFDIARNGAVQQYQALLGARARVSLARKALADTVVRAPFTGVVGERLVSVGDYVTRGTKVASVMRTNPLRLELTVPQQFSLEVRVGRAVSLEVDTAPGKTFTGQVRYVSPALQTDSRTLIVEAVVANPDGSLKPGSFATAQIEQADEHARRARAGRGRADRVGHRARLRRGGRPRRRAPGHHRAGRWAIWWRSRPASRPANRSSRPTSNQLVDGVRVAVHRVLRVVAGTRGSRHAVAC